jgi:uncharacterized protein
MILSILSGLLCGVALGLTGGGGSILAVPLLIYAAHISVHQAVAISLLIVGIIALIGFIPKLIAGEIEIFAGIILAISGVFLAPLGTLIGALVSGNILISGFSILMVCVGFWAWLKPKISQLNQPNNSSVCRYLPNGKLHLTYKCQMILVICGAITGFLTGFFGVGGGFIIVPALILAAKIPLKKAISTSLLIIFLISSSGFISHVSNTNIPWLIALYFSIGGTLGMVGANWLKNKINDSHLQKIFSALLVVLGIIMLTHQLLQSS